MKRLRSGTLFRWRSAIEQAGWTTAVGVLLLLIATSPALARTSPDGLRGAVSRAPHRARRPAVSDDHAYIVGGTDAAQGQLGFMAFIVHRDSSGNPDFLCSGTLLSSNVVMTAGHCAIDESTYAPLDPSGYQVVTGAADWTDTANRTVSGVSRVVVDPAYNPATKSSDAALLVLATPSPGPTIRLAGSSDLSLEQAGAGAVIAGWGDTYPGATLVQNVLQWAPTVVQGPAYCAQVPFANFSFNPDTELCAANYPTLDTATCNGDSGGPLIAADSTGNPVEIGITSLGPADCNTNTADYFTAVEPLSSWAASWINAEAPQQAPPGPTPAPPQTPSAPQLPFMTMSVARTDVRSTLRGAFHHTMLHSHAYHSACTRKTRARVTCQFSFWAGPNDYYGMVTVYYESVSGNTVYWTDNYTMHWVNDQCYYHSGHRHRCVLHTRRGKW